MRYIGIVLLIVSVLFTQSRLVVFAETLAVPDEAFEKLTTMLEEEKIILENLFVLVSEIELLNTQVQLKEKEIEVLNDRYQDKEAALEVMQTTYETIKTSLKYVLRHQQRVGIGSYLEILFKSTGIKDLIHRINLLRDLSKNTADLIDNIEHQKAMIEVEKVALAEIIVAVENQKNEIEAALDAKENVKQALERTLESLSSDRAHYEAYLESIEMVWVDLKPLFTDTIATFNQIIENDELPEDTIELKLGFLSAKGIIREETFNRNLSLRDDLPELEFRFLQDEISLYFPSHEMILTGQFELIEDQKVLYRVHSGSFYGLDLSDHALEDLFSFGDIVFNMASILGRNTIKSIDMRSGVIELDIIIRIF